MFFPDLRFYVMFDVTKVLKLQNATNFPILLFTLGTSLQFVSASETSGSATANQGKPFHKHDISEVFLKT